MWLFNQRELIEDNIFIYIVSLPSQTITLLIIWNLPKSDIVITIIYKYMVLVMKIHKYADES